MSEIEQILNREIEMLRAEFESQIAELQKIAKQADTSAVAEKACQSLSVIARSADSVAFAIGQEFLENNS